MLGEILKGAISGCASTVPMSVLMEAGYHLLPLTKKYALPPRQITVKILKELGLNDDFNNEEVDLLTLLSHFGYGASMGILYQLLMHNRNASVKNGALFGVAVWTASYLGWLPALGIRKPATQESFERNCLMILAHIVWGASLGGVQRALQLQSDEP
jgi:uncharacterized membrane protein YagU involved in acid resistance